MSINICISDISDDADDDVGISVNEFNRKQCVQLTFVSDVNSKCCKIVQ